MSSLQLGPPDDMLVQASRRGDKEAYDMLVQRYWKPVCSIVQKRLPLSFHEVQEVVQDTFAKAWQAMERYASAQGTFCSWLCTIALNLAKDRLRRVQTKEAAHEYYERAYGIEWGCEPVPVPDAGLIDAVKRMLSKLPQENLQALYEHYYGNLTHMEISRHLQLPLGTVKAQIRRGIEKLRSDPLASRLKYA